MTQFIQIHLLTAYPPANLNRDDTGRPKTAVMGGALRLRISSQSLKRAWRTSDVFRQRIQERERGQRTRQLGEKVLEYLKEKGVGDEDARKVARHIAAIFGKNDEKAEEKGHSGRIKQLAFISPEEKEAALKLADSYFSGQSLDKDKFKELPKDKNKKEKELASLRKEILRETDKATDIAMFGRMLADSPEYNREASVQVAHAITTHKVTVEDDYYTAIDDLKRADEDAGAGFLGVQEYGAGLFYLYICINRTLLEENLDSDKKLAGKACAALVESAATVAPKGKQASYASHARASYIMAERGEQQPRSLVAAFYGPVWKDDYVKSSIDQLEEFRKNLDTCYGDCAEEHRVMNTSESEGSLAEIVEFISR